MGLRKVAEPWRGLGDPTDTDEGYPKDRMKSLVADIPFPWTSNQVPVHSVNIHIPGVDSIYRRNVRCRYEKVMGGDGIVGPYIGS